MKSSEKSGPKMRWVILSLFCVAAKAAKLNNLYLPPPNAKDAGGRDDDLQVPLEPPYIDPYSDNSHLVPDPEGRHGFGYKSKGQPRDGSEDEDQSRDPSTSRGRFLYGSYSYAGPDNVIVTVTYPADRKKAKNNRGQNDDYDRNGYFYDEYDYFEGGVIPTPPSLPEILQGAFNLNREKKLPKDNRKDRKRGKQPWNEQPTERPIIHSGYSFPRNMSSAIRNLQIANQSQN